jgi:hypothetical protein
LWSEGRIVVHSFGAADWREVVDDLRVRGLFRGEAGAAGSAPAPRPPSASQRAAVARSLWAAGRPLQGTLGERHLRRRRIWRALPDDLRFHPAAPIAVYAGRSAAKPALVAAIRDVRGELTGVELTYLDPDGRRTTALRLSRKTVGAAPSGSAVRLDPASAELLVAEGVATALSASERFSWPAWALRSAQNLAHWRFPASVRRVLVAGDRGSAGEAAAEALASRLARGGVEATVVLPPAPFGDWNEAAARGKGRAGKGAP